MIKNRLVTLLVGHQIGILLRAQIEQLPLTTQRQIKGRAVFIAGTFSEIIK